MAWEAILGNYPSDVAAEIQMPWEAAAPELPITVRMVP
jgi:hypothetical protein